MRTAWSVRTPGCSQTPTHDKVVFHMQVSAASNSIPESKHDFLHNTGLVELCALCSDTCPCTRIFCDRPVGEWITPVLGALVPSCTGGCEQEDTACRSKREQPPTGVNIHNRVLGTCKSSSQSQLHSPSATNASAVQPSPRCLLIQKDSSTCSSSATFEMRAPVHAEAAPRHCVMEILHPLAPTNHAAALLTGQSVEVGHIGAGKDAITAALPVVMTTPATREHRVCVEWPVDPAIRIRQFQQSVQPLAESNLDCRAKPRYAQVYPKEKQQCDIQPQTLPTTSITCDVESKSLLKEMPEITFANHTQNGVPPEPTPPHHVHDVTRLTVKQASRNKKTSNINGSPMICKQTLQSARDDSKHIRPLTVMAQRNPSRQYAFQEPSMKALHNAWNKDGKAAALEPRRRTGTSRKLTPSCDLNEEGVSYTRTGTDQVAQRVRRVGGLKQFLGRKFERKFK